MYAFHGKVYGLLLITAASLAFDTLYLGMKNNRSMAYRNRLEVTPHITVTDYMTAFAVRTAHFIATLLDIQNYLAIFVAETVALES